MGGQTHEGDKLLRGGQALVAGQAPKELGTGSSGDGLVWEDRCWGGGRGEQTLEGRQAPRI